MTRLRIGPGPNVIKLFRPKFTNFRAKLERLSLASFPANSNKQSSLVNKLVNYLRKCFIILALCAYIIKHFYGRN